MIITKNENVAALYRHLDVLLPDRQLTASLTESSRDRHWRLICGAERLSELIPGERLAEGTLERVLGYPEEVPREQWNRADDDVGMVLRYLFESASPVYLDVDDELGFVVRAHDVASG